jgi:hypothetical protein
MMAFEKLFRGSTGPAARAAQDSASNSRADTGHLDSTV